MLSTTDWQVVFERIDRNFARPIQANDKRLFIKYSEGLNRATILSIIKNLIETRTDNISFSPPSKFLKIKNEILRKEFKECTQCKDGEVLAKKINELSEDMNVYKYSFLCSCNKGQERQRQLEYKDLPSWNESLKKEFTIFQPKTVSKKEAWRVINEAIEKASQGKLKIDNRKVKSKSLGGFMLNQLKVVNGS